MTSQPREVAGVCPFFNFSEQVDRFCFVARFAWIVDRDHHFDVHRNDVALRLDQSSAFHALTWNAHFSPNVKASIPPVSAKAHAMGETPRGAGGIESG